MGTGRLGHRRPRAEAVVGDLEYSKSPYPKRFVGLVLDKSITVYRIKVVSTGEEMYWPESAVYLWKETK